MATSAGVAQGKSPARGLPAAGLAALGALLCAGGCTALLDIDEDYKPRDSGSAGAGAGSGSSGTSAVGGVAGVAGAGGSGGDAQPAPRCDDGAHNGFESDVDCGGSCPACGDGAACGSHVDCQSGLCDASGRCQSPSPSCEDGVQNGTETDVDCGGGTCVPCAPGGACQNGPRDCQSLICEADVCTAPSCGDGIRNGAEWGVDCAGGCPACPDGTACNDAAQCQGGFCVDGACRNACKNLVKDGEESDVDCGGPVCPRCPCPMRCKVDSDCSSGFCTPFSWFCTC
jgi:hypothetical protein